MPVPTSSTPADVIDQDGPEWHDQTLGSRLPCHVETENGQTRTFEAAWAGGRREGMVGKPSTTRIGQGMPLVHKTIRMRSRKAFDDNLEKHSPSTESRDLKFPGSTHFPHAHSSSLTIQSMDMDAAEEDQMDVDSDPKRNTCSRTPSDASTTLTDFSNYLPSRSHSCEDMDTVATTMESQDCRFASPSSDLYGWDAELQRRSNFSSCAMENCQDGCEPITLRYRRANGSRSNLFQRVFNVGSSSSLGKYESSH